MLRPIQSVPSPKAEPIKPWLAKRTYERIQEMADPAMYKILALQKDKINS